MEGYELRRATVEDIRVIVHHREAMFREMGTDGDYETMRPALAVWLANAIPSEKYRAWLVEDAEGRVAGGIGLVVHDRMPSPHRIEPSSGYVYNVYVEPEHRRLGLARSLMETVHDWCLRHGIRLISLHSSKLGASLYLSMGYEPTNEMRLLLTVD